jgi:predicted acetyltransferase
VFALVKPSAEHLESYVAALKRGWSPDNLRDETRIEQLHRIASDPQAFLSALDDREGKSGPIRLADGSFVPRLPGFKRWMWDGDFAGTIGLRWQPGTSALPPWCLGHIGYGVVPWKRRRGYATAALRLILPEARDQGLLYVELTTEEENVASQRVILANGGVCVGRFEKSTAHGDLAGLRFCIDLTKGEAADATQKRSPCAQ